jgi:hypothetical protein
MEPTRNDRLIQALDDAHIRRFWAKVRVGAPGACWEWTAARTLTGYGTWSQALPGGAYASLRPHRVSYILAHGPISPETPELDHLCRNRACVNPDHLEPVTHLENQRRIPRAPRDASRSGSIHERVRADGAIAYRVIFRFNDKQSSRNFATRSDAERLLGQIRALGVGAALDQMESRSAS